MSPDNYIWFRIFLWLTTLAFILLNFVTWLTKDMDINYRRYRRKNGWWLLACIAFIIFQTNYWSLK